MTRAVETQVRYCPETHIAPDRCNTNEAGAYNCTMRSVTGLISILITAASGIFVYMYFLKQASPGPGMVVTQDISIVGVKNDLIAIAQAERMYCLQNNTYA